MKTMLDPSYPMIAPKHFSEHTPESWLAFVKSLKIVPEAKPEASLKLKRTKTGKLSVTLPRTRKPAWVLQSEIETLARENNETIAEVYNTLKKKGALIIKTKTKEKK